MYNKDVFSCTLDVPQGCTVYSCTLDVQQGCILGEVDFWIFWIFNFLQFAIYGINNSKTTVK
jgi:hypothetical protein